MEIAMDAQFGGCILQEMHGMQARQLNKEHAGKEYPAWKAWPE